MPSNRIIPSLLMMGGRLVKGVGFRAHRDAGSPATTARTLNAQQADEIVLLDIDAGRTARGLDLDAIASVAKECQIPLTVGGGIASVAMARGCLRCGADKVFVNAAARRRPGLIDELAHEFGSQAVVVGIDVVGRPGNGWSLFGSEPRELVAGAGGAEDWASWLVEAVERGAGEIRLMAVDREGTRSGLDVDLFAEAAGRVDVPLILEGGAGKLSDVEAAMSSGVDAVALGTMLVFSDNNIVQVKRHLKNAGFPIRL